MAAFSYFAYCQIRHIVYVNIARMLAEKKKGIKNMSKANLESYHWETVNDVDFFTNGVVCTDINIKDTVKQLCFQHMVIDIDRDNKKVFPSVEEICISPEVVNICIPNRMFPNVKNVKSNSKVFKSGKYLVVKSTLRLLNAFGQSEDTPLDGSDFISINEYALDGCKSHEFVNLFSGDKFTTYENSFTGSGFMEQPFANGLKAFRTQYETTILDIDENADIVILPEGKIKFHQLKPAKCVKVSDAKSLYYAARLAPEKIILEPGSNTAEPFDNADDFVEALYCIRSLKTIESHIPQYKTVDGVLYNKDMSALLVCPRGKNGNITIPEGVTKIKEFAFANSKIEKVSFPDTLKKIEKHAFYECSRLKSVDFGNGIEEVGGVNVFAFSSIAKLEIPPQVKTIGDGAFYYCNKLKEVKFNEGLQEIGNDAFSRCDLIKNLDFPETLRYIGNRAFHPGLLRTEDIVVNLKSIPCNFIAAFVKEERSPGTICINVHMDNAADVFDFVIPEYMSHYGFLTTDTAFDMLPDKKAAETLNEAYFFAISTTSRSIAAFKAYRKTRDEKIKKEIQENYLLTALSIIAFMNEDDFIDFLKLVEVRYNKRILNRLQKKGWLPSVSYILQNAKETEKEDFTLS